MKKKIDDKTIENAEKAYLVQDNQMKKASNRLSELSDGLNSLSDINNQNLNDLDVLLSQANKMLKAEDIDLSDVKKNAVEKKDYKVPVFEDLDTIEIDEEMDWNTYIDNISSYAKKNGVDLTRDPFEELLTEEERQTIAKRLKEDYTMRKANCDKYDYMIAAFCGIVAGVIDVFFVGMPEKSKLGNWTDKKVDQFVVNIAEIKKKSQFTGDNKVAKAIAYLEGEYKVNYDQNTGKAAGELLGMSMSNHHIKSLAHSPDIIGLIFSIVDQFTGTSHFLDNGRLITFDTEKMELKGNNFIAKLFSGIANWLGHLMSDVAGSYSGRNNNPDGRGSGIPMPLFELFQLIDKGSFKVYSNNDISSSHREMSFADLSVKIFEEGYDARFGMTQAIPVVINELSIRLIWSMKRRFYHNLPWKDCLPFGNQPELRRMLLTGYGVLCLVDAVDAVTRSKGQILLFALHLNFPAWKRLAFSGLMEIRGIYKENAINLDSLEKDLKMEWNILYNDSK